MALIIRPNTYVPGTVIRSSEVNDDFDTIYTLVNGNIDGANIDLTSAFAWTGSHTFSSNVGLNATTRLIFDVNGDSDTYIFESAPDTLNVVAGGVNVCTFDTTIFGLSGTVDMAIGAGSQIFLDGGVHTYLIESADNVFKTFVGGTDMFELNLVTGNAVFRDASADFFLANATGCGIISQKLLTLSHHQISLHHSKK